MNIIIGGFMSYSFLGGDSRDNFSDQEDLFKVIESFMGYLPNSHLSMAAALMN